MKYRVGVELTSEGFTVILDTTKHPVIYPAEVWHAFPKKLQQNFAEFIAFVSTVSYAFGKNNFVEYLFPAPVSETFFYFGLLMSMPENWADTESKKLKTSQYLQIAYNSYFHTRFTGTTVTTEVPFYTPKPKSALIPFSFGKDSLLTYAVAKEIGLCTNPIFLLEQKNTFENKHKLQLANAFAKEFKEPITIFSTPLTALKRDGAFSWGWDLLLTQYTLFLIPFMHYYQAEYFFWSNEQNCSYMTTDPEGFAISTTFDQNARWLQTLNTVLRQFGVPAKLGSLIETISEIADFYVVHKRYPEIAKYQLTCQGEHPTKRWCGKCYDCAKFYLYMKAFVWDPKRVGIVDDMFTETKIKKLRLFPKSKPDFWRDTFPNYFYEKLLAFDLVARQGDVSFSTEKFRNEYLPMVGKKRHELINEYFSVSPPITTPEELVVRVTNIFKTELRTLKTNLSHL